MTKTLTIPWTDGNGDIILTYDGQGDGVVTLRSTTDNLGDERRQVITLRTVDGGAQAQMTVIQSTGMQILLDADGKALRGSDNKVLRVYPSADRIPSQ